VSRLGYFSHQERRLRAIFANDIVFILIPLKNVAQELFAHNWVLVLPFNSNSKYHTHPNNRIEIGGYFLSILDLEFSVQFNSELKLLHPNTGLIKVLQKKLQRSSIL
jgi:hypothetical protein